MKIDGRALEICTEVFKTFSGTFGPLKIRFNLEQSSKEPISFEIRLAHDAASKTNSGSGFGGGFCFGATRETIESLLRAGKISKAFGVMTESFLTI